MILFENESGRQVILYGKFSILFCDVDSQIRISMFVSMPKAKQAYIHMQNCVLIIYVKKRNHLPIRQTKVLMIDNLVLRYNMDKRAMHSITIYP